MELRSVFRVWKSPRNKLNKLLQTLWEEKGQEFSFSIKELGVYPYYFLYLKEKNLHLNLGSMDFSNYHRYGSPLLGFSSVIASQIDFIHGREYEIKLKVDGMVFHEQSFRYESNMELVLPWRNGKRGSFIIRPLYTIEKEGLSLENESFMLAEEIHSLTHYETERFYEELKSKIYAKCDFNLDILHFVRMRIRRRMERKHPYRIKTESMYLSVVQDLIKEYGIEEINFNSKTKWYFYYFKSGATPSYDLQTRKGDPSPFSKLDCLKIWIKKIEYFFL